MMKRPVYKSLTLDRCDGTRLAYDVSRVDGQWPHTTCVWAARVNMWTTGPEIASGGLNLGEMSAIRTTQRQIVSTLTIEVQL